MRRDAIACCAVLSLAACTPPPTTAPSGDGAARADDGAPHPGRVSIDAPGVFSVPLESALLPIVPCEIDGAETRTALLDTGSGGSLIAPAQADRIKGERRPMEPQNVGTILATGSLDTTWMRVPQLRIGLMAIRDAGMPILRPPLQIDSLVGSDVLAQTTMLMEAKSRKVSFGSPAQIEALIDKRYPGAARSALAIVRLNGLFTLVAESGSGTWSFLLDTGSNASMLNPTTVKARGLPLKFTERTHTEDLATSTTAQVEFYEFDGLRLGAWTIDLVVEASASPMLDELHLDGVLGFDVLGQVPWVFDPQRERIVVVAPKDDATHHLSIGGETDLDVRRMCADPYVPIRLNALRMIAVLGERRDLDFAGPLLSDPESEVCMTAAYVIRKVLGADWPDDETLHRAIQWWQDPAREAK